MNGWQPDGTGIVSNGDCGGDTQRGDSYSVRYRHPGLPGAVITSSAYAIERDDRPGEFFVEVQTEWLLCSDPGRPADTETWSDYDHEEQDGSWATEDQAEAEARRTAQGLLRAAGDLDWDGRPPWDT